MPNRTRKKREKIDAEFQRAPSQRKQWPQVMNLQMVLRDVEYVTPGAALLHFQIATINGEHPGQYPTEFMASILLHAEHVPGLVQQVPKQVPRPLNAQEEKMLTDGIVAQLMLDKVTQLAQAAQEASVVATQAALTVGQAARRVTDALGQKA